MTNLSLKVVTQVVRMVMKVFGRLAFIVQGPDYMSWDVMSQLYKMLVRLHLDYCGHLVMDVIKLEKVQKIFTRGKAWELQPNICGQKVTREYSE